MVTISDLPEHIRHLILSFLPTADAMATAQLSKSWKHDWLTLPFLNLDEQFYKQIIRHRFHSLSSDCGLTLHFNFLVRILKRRAALQGRFSYLHCLQGLSLSLHYVKNRSSLLADKLLDYAFSSFKIEILELSQSFLENTFQLESLSNMNAHTLKSLSLNDIQVNQNLVDMLATGCPFLELFKLTYCYVSDSVVEIRGLNKLADLCLIQNMFYKRKIVINLPRLESLYYTIKNYLSDFDMDIISASDLKHLTINGRILKGGLLELERLLFRLPSLERLELQFLLYFGGLRIINHTLKNLILKLNLVKLVEFGIDAPNLEHFIYFHTGTVEEGIVGTPLYMMDNNFTPKKAIVELNPRDLKDKRFVELLGEINRRSKYMEVRIDWIDVVKLIKCQYDYEPCCEIRDVVLLNCSSATFQESHGDGVDAVLRLFPNAETVKTETGQVLHRRS